LEEIKVLRPWSSLQAGPRPWSSAVKFAPEKCRISLRLHPAADTLEIGLTNTFEKLPDEELKKIFDPFHRIPKPQAAGSGLGLAIAKKIIERHGGRIEASNVEEGLEIRIVLPRKKRLTRERGKL
jgi:signal transduction histidine kinase